MGCVPSPSTVFPVTETLLRITGPSKNCGNQANSRDGICGPSPNSTSSVSMVCNRTHFSLCYMVAHNLFGATKHCGPPSIYGVTQ